MTGQGGFTSTPNRQLRRLVLAQVFWLAVVFLIGAWWSRLVLRQAGHIAELETRLGISASSTLSTWTRTQRMLFWESGAYYLLLLGSTGLLIWIYWRDLKRTRSLHAFFASVTHELRTPLTSIRLQAESIADEVSSGDKNLIRRLLEDTARLEGQVERTLELARVEGGGPVFSQNIALRTIVDRTVSSWKNTWGDRVAFSVKVDDQYVEADGSAIQMILKNLLENSIRHSSKDTLRIEILSSMEGKSVVLRFSDNGESRGDAPKEIGSLFQKGAKSQGAGVGLYLVSALMSRMGGKAIFEGGAGFPVKLLFKEANPHG